jgi:L-iditol 2-dehydrogenase
VLRYALVLESPNQLVVREHLDQLPLADDEALVETLYVGLCGTDLEVIDGSSDRARPPVILGHEWAGRVTALGARSDSRLAGAFVVGENLVGCREIGFELPGGFSSHFALPTGNLHPLPDFLRGPAACLVEPLAVSVHAIGAAGLQAGDSVLVLGDGVIGLLTARTAALTAKHVMLVGKHEERLRIARKLGIESVSLGHDVDHAWSVVFEASGRPTGLKVALEAAAPRARVVLVGDYGSAPVPTLATTVVRKQLQVIGANASAGAWDDAVRLASTKAVDLSVVSTLVLPFDQWREGLEAAREHKALRVVLRHRAVDLSP